MIIRRSIKSQTSFSKVLLSFHFASCVLQSETPTFFLSYLSLAFISIQEKFTSSTVIQYTNHFFSKRLHFSAINVLYLLVTILQAFHYAQTADKVPSVTRQVLMRARFMSGLVFYLHFIWTINLCLFIVMRASVKNI